jgi:SnoaL-like domain
MAEDPIIDQLIDSYCEAWSDPDPARRREILRAVWADGATYTDPTVHAEGLDDLLAHIDEVLARRQGAKVVRTSRVDAHHGLARFAWHVVQADGTPLPEGLDLAELSADGRIRRIIGFFGPLPRAGVPD